MLLFRDLVGQSMENERCLGEDADVEIIFEGTWWAAIPVKLIDNNRLSHTARWIGAFICSRPPGWKIWRSHLFRIGEEPGGTRRKKIYRGLRELEAEGYLRRSQSRTPDGGFGPMKYVFCIPEEKSLTKSNKVTVCPSAAHGSAARRSGAHINTITRTKNTKKKTDDDQQSSMSSSSKFFPPTSGPEGEKIINQVAALEYPGKEISRNLRRALQNLLKEGKLQIPEGWEALRSRRASSLEREKDNADENQRLEAFAAAFDSLPQEEKEKYFARAREVANGLLSPTSLALRSIATCEFMKDHPLFQGASPPG